MIVCFVWQLNDILIHRHDVNAHMMRFSSQAGTFGLNSHFTNSFLEEWTNNERQNSFYLFIFYYWEIRIYPTKSPSYVYVLRHAINTLWKYDIILFFVPSPSGCLKIFSDFSHFLQRVMAVLFARTIRFSPFPVTTLSQSALGSVNEHVD